MSSIRRASPATTETETSSGATVSMHFGGVTNAQDGVGTKVAGEVIERDVFEFERFAVVDCWDGGWIGRFANELRGCVLNLVAVGVGDGGTEVNADDGDGFDTTQKSNGIGITNIISRAELFNGRVKIESSPGKGCRMQVSFSI